MKSTNTALKIAYVLDDGLDSEDGVQQYIRSLGAWFTTRGHEVHYLVGETKRTDIPNVHSMATNAKIRFNGNILTIPLPASRRRIRELLDHHHFDIIHVQEPYSPFFGARVIKAAGPRTSIVGTFHILPYGIAAHWGTKFLGYILRPSLSRFDRHFSVSPAASAFARQTFGIESQVMPNVIDISKFSVPKHPNRSATKRNTLRIVFVGRLVERKGCHFLLKAYAEALKKDPGVNTELIICGKGPQIDDLQHLSSKLGIESRVTFLGFVSEIDKISHLQNADLAVFPSYAGESFGIVLIEAMAAGAGAVLGGDNPGYRSVLGDTTPAIVDVKNTNGFADILFQFITDAQLRRQTHNRQQKIVRSFDINLVGGKLLKEYLDCKKTLAPR